MQIPRWELCVVGEPRTDYPDYGVESLLPLAAASVRAPERSSICARPRQPSTREAARTRSRALKARTAEQRVIDDEEHSGAQRRDDHAIEIESGHSAHSKDVEEPAPTIAPPIPSRTSKMTPSPVRLTILLATKPAMSPRMIHAIIDMTLSGCNAAGWSTVHPVPPSQLQQELWS